ncbi:MAG: SH3 domain-containing protein [Elainellaceae cyanobacterium]
MRMFSTLATATLSAIALTAGLWTIAPSTRADINVQINTGSSHGDRYRHGDRYYRDSDRYYRDDVPVVRTILPDGRIIERYGYPRDQRQVIVLPSPTVIRQPVYSQPVYSQPIYSQPIIQQPIQIPQQIQEPRILHGQQVSPFSAVVVGAGHLSGREGPGNVYSTLTQFAAGQAVTITRRAGGGDGYDWYLAASTAGQYAWLRGDRLAIYTQGY